MTDFSLSAPQKQGRTFSEWVWFDGTVALLEGQGMCYEFNYLAPATQVAVADVEQTADARRYNRVQVPTSTLAGHFAGVCARNYPASPVGQMIEIYGPNSVCNVLLNPGVTTALASATALACTYDATHKAGTFKTGTATGKSGALALQTVTSDGTTLFKCLAVLQTGAQLGVVA